MPLPSRPAPVPAGASSPSGRDGTRVLARAFALVALAVLQGCAGPSFDMTPGTEPVFISDYSPEQREVMRAEVLDSLKRGRTRYGLRIDDQLEVVFHARPRAVGSYPIQMGDQITVTLPDNPDLNATAKVRPDGWISLPEAGEVRAAGRDIRALNEAVRESYGEVLRNARPNVALDDWTLPEERFIEDIETIANGRAKVIPVLPDGTVALPFLDPIDAQGLTIPELTGRINAAYAALGLSIETSVLMRQPGGDRIFVFGEVQNPGMVTTNRPQTVLMSVARAGGLLTTGTMSDIRVLYVDEAGEPHLRRVNLTNVLTELKLEEDITLPNNAIVYVPPSKLAQTGRLLDQVLRQILFFQGFSGSVTYELFRQDN